MVERRRDRGGAESRAAATVGGCADEGVRTRGDVGVRCGDKRAGTGDVSGRTARSRAGARRR